MRKISVVFKILGIRNFTFKFAVTKKKLFQFGDYELPYFFEKEVSAKNI